MNEKDIFNWIAHSNYDVMTWMNSNWWDSLLLLVIAGFLIGMSPLKIHYDHKFTDYILIYVRKAILICYGLLTLICGLTLYVYYLTMKEQIDPFEAYQEWFYSMTADNLWNIVGVILGGITYQLLRTRYGLALLSRLKKKLRFKVSEEKISDIRDEFKKHTAKDFDPSTYYREN